MEKIMIIFMQLLMAIQTVFTGNTADVFPENATYFIKQENFKIEDWKVYSKENLGAVSNLQELEELVQKIGKQSKITDWRYEKVENHHYKITGQLHQETSRKLTIIVFGIFNNKGYDVSVNQVVEGQTNFDNKPLKLLDLSQTGKAEVFYTFTASRTGGYETAEMLEMVQKYMSQLSAKEVEKLVEKNFVSISAYSPNLNNSLSLEGNRKMNLQVAMRSLDNKTTITIGSPIITTEY